MQYGLEIRGERERERQIDRKRMENLGGRGRQWIAAAVKNLQRHKHAHTHIYTILLYTNTTISSDGGYKKAHLYLLL